MHSLETMKRVNDEAAEQEIAKQKGTVLFTARELQDLINVLNYRIEDLQDMVDDQSDDDGSVSITLLATSNLKVFTELRDKLSNAAWS